MSRERMRAEAEAREARTVTVRLVQRDLQRVHTNTRKHGRRHTRAHIHAHADGCGGRARRRSLRAARRCSAAVDGVQRTWPRGPSGSAATTRRRGSAPRCARMLVRVPVRTCVHKRVRAEQRTLWGGLEEQARLQRVAACCTALQQRTLAGGGAEQVARCCSMLQRVATAHAGRRRSCGNARSSQRSPAARSGCRSDPKP